MQKKCHKCIVILGSLNILCGVVIWYVLAYQNLISFEVAYFSTFLVIISSYFTLRNKLKEETQEGRDPTSDTQNSHKTRNFSKFALGVRLSLGLYRIVAYVILALGVVILMDYGLFGVIGYTLGVIVCLVSILLFKIRHSN